MDFVPYRVRSMSSSFLLLKISTIKILGIFPEACAEAIAAIQDFMVSL